MTASRNSHNKFRNGHDYGKAHFGPRMSGVPLNYKFIV